MNEFFLIVAGHFGRQHRSVESKSDGFVFLELDPLSGCISVVIELRCVANFGRNIVSSDPQLRLFIYYI